MTCAWRLLSPNGRMGLEITSGEEGTWMSVAAGGVPVFTIPQTGVSTSLVDASAGLAFVSEKTDHFAETYRLPGGKNTEYAHRSNELALSFVKNGCPVTLRARMFDEGAAYRWELGGGGTGLGAGGKHGVSAGPKLYGVLAPEPHQHL